MLRDILELVRDIKDTDSYIDTGNDGMPSFKALSKSSISRKSNEAIFQFPVMVSSSMSAEDMLLISKALERQYVTFIRISSGLDDIIVDPDGKFNKLDKIREMHQNIGITSSNLSQVQSLLKESSNKLLEPFDNIYNTKVLNETAGVRYDHRTKKLLENQIIDNIDFHQYSGNNGSADDDTIDVLTSDNSLKTTDVDDVEMFDEAAGKIKGYTKVQRRTDIFNLSKQKNERSMFETDNAIKRGQLDKLDMDLTASDIKMQKDQFDLVKSMRIGSKDSRYTNQLTDNEIKKSNEMVPTLLDLELTVLTKAGAYPVRILLGVKTINHLIPSDELIYNIATSIKQKRLFFRTIQWTTGEIKFIKDFILNIDGMRTEALASRKNSNMWRIFKNRSKLDKIRRFSFSKNKFLPNGTIVITTDELAQIKNVHGIDLMRPAEAQKLMDIFFLLGFVITDTASELAYFLFDGYTSYQTFTYSSLEKETGNSSTEIKKILDLMGRVR